MQKKDGLLPWNHNELEKLLLELIAHGSETAKADFKLEIETGTNEQKAELLKDIIAIANTYDEDNYGDYGFLIFGVTAKSVAGISKTEPNTDNFQGTIDQLLKDYISPMPQIYVMGFETEDKKKWGAVVIPPRNNKPHMFSKELQCVDQRRSRKRGEWFVRRGATTDVGLPEDLARISQKQLELQLEPLRESIASLQSRIGKAEEQYNSALFEIVKRALSGSPTPSTPTTLDSAFSQQSEESVPDIEAIVGIDLPAKLKQKLQRPQDVLAEELILEAKVLHDFLYGSNTGLPWALQLGTPDEKRTLIETLEEKTRRLQLSIATVILNDRKGEYTNALLRAVKILAKVGGAPPGIPFNASGTALRFYPLGIILYTIFGCGVVAGRGDLLRDVIAIPLILANRNNAMAPIGNFVYYWYDARAFFNDAFGQRWCEPLPTRIRQLMSDRVAEMAPDTTEAELFFRGEFMLVLSEIVVRSQKGAEADGRVPLPGLYLYMDAAETTILELLREHPAWIDEVYSQPMNEILDSFDQNAHKVTGPGCISMAFHGSKTAEVYRNMPKR